MPESAARAQIAAFLKTVPLFAGLGEQALGVFAQAAFLKRVEKGQVIFRRGDVAQAVYVVRAGAVAEFVGGANALEMLVKARRPGDFFGETGMLVDEPQLVSAIAIQQTTLLGIPRQTFLDQFWGEPSMTKYMVRILIRRLKISGERQIYYAQLDARARLAYVLLWMEQDEGAGVVGATQEYVAQCCGLARQTVARILGEWRRAGLINTLHEKIEVTDRAALVQVMLGPEAK